VLGELVVFGDHGDRHCRKPVPHDLGLEAQVCDTLRPSVEPFYTW
jgi:hypothetical protein